MVPDDVPTFFFSHARQDRNRYGRYLQRFFEDLNAEVAACAGVEIESNRIGMIDLQIRQGADWDSVLSGPLSSDKVFVAILSPIYFERDYCGKELYAFVLRSPNLGIDIHGALINVENLLPIRWFSEDYYCANGEKEGKIPPILRRLNYVPFDDLGDPGRQGRSSAIASRGWSNASSLEPNITESFSPFSPSIFAIWPTYGVPMTSALRPFATPLTMTGMNTSPGREGR
jgi:hypothetical protein